MADGGIHDQLGGGFHRYSTDAKWLVPHFEQMLYDNAQLARVYLHAWQLTGDERYRDVATGTLDYLVRELTTDDGAFAASQDADTEGVEGATFIWTAAEIRDVLGDTAALFEAAYGVTDAGNWEGQHDPEPGRPGRRAGRPVRPDRGRRSAPARRGSRVAPGAARRPGPAGARWQGPGGLERACDRRVRRRRRRPVGRRP